jgi:hypothetical protein
MSGCVSVDTSNKHIILQLKEFNCTFDDIKVDKYFEDWWYGMKKYVLKDPACAKSHHLPSASSTIEPQ